MNIHERFMLIALNQAKRNIGNIAPNPSVGCIIVKNNVIVGAGNTGFGGRPHAETIAIKQAKNKTEGAVMYVTMEPCVHYGVTSPCVQAIIRANIAKVFIALKDPDPRINGKGINMLKQAGVQVKVGLCAEKAYDINIGFIYNIFKSRPFITVKIACTIDCKIADYLKKSQWITSDLARSYTHKLRALNDAVMVGCNTIITDDALLTCRLNGMENLSPIRVILDTHNRTASNQKLKIFSSEEPIWIITNRPKSNFDQVEYIYAKCNKKSGMIDIRDALEKLAVRGITRLLVEGGSKLITTLFSNEMVDNLIIITSPKVAGEEALSGIGELNLKLQNFKQFTKTDSINLIKERISIYQYETKRPYLSELATSESREDQEGSDA